MEKDWALCEPLLTPPKLEPLFNDPTRGWSIRYREVCWDNTVITPDMGILHFDTLVNRHTYYKMPDCCVGLTTLQMYEYYYPGTYRNRLVPIRIGKIRTYPLGKRQLEKLGLSSVAHLF